jgi:hypothetical protein
MSAFAFARMLWHVLGAAGEERAPPPAEEASEAPEVPELVACERLEIHAVRIPASKVLVKEEAWCGRVRRGGGKRARVSLSSRSALPQRL